MKRFFLYAGFPVVRILAMVSLFSFSVMGNGLKAQSTPRYEKLPYGDFENWLVRLITESRIVGGEEQKVYAVAENGTVRGNVPYVNEKSPWGTSNVYSSVMGVEKVNVNVYPGEHKGGKCAVMKTEMMSFRVMGMMKYNVLTPGAVFIGKMFEPIRDMDNAYSSQDMGMPFTKRPKAVVFDYAATIRNSGVLTYAKGKTVETYKGKDKALIMVHLQKRWEKDGKVYAQRVATAELLIDRSTPWKDGFRLPFVYGKPSGIESLSSYSHLHDTFYTVNSKGEHVPIQEVGWAPADAVPTHLILFASSGIQEPYKGELGNELKLDNVMLEY